MSLKLRQGRMTRDTRLRIIDGNKLSEKYIADESPRAKHRHHIPIMLNADE